MDSVSKNEIRERIEYILSYLLSKKHNCNVKIYLKKETITNDNTDKTRNLEEE